MNIAVDIIAAFNSGGEIKPLYIRLEDENHNLISYKLEVKYEKSEHYAGINSLLFHCSYTSYENVIKEIDVKYYVESHKWVLVDN